MELLKSGYDVVVVDDFSNSSLQVVDRLKTITGVTVPFYQGSIADKKFMSQVFEENHIDAVIHFTVYEAVGEFVQEPLKYKPISNFNIVKYLIVNDYQKGYSPTPKCQNSSLKCHFLAPYLPFGSKMRPDMFLVPKPLLFALN